MGEALQHALDEGTLSLADVAELQLTGLIQHQTAEDDFVQQAGQNSSEQIERRSSEDTVNNRPSEGQEPTSPKWKTLSKPVVPVKVSKWLPLFRQLPEYSMCLLQALFREILLHHTRVERNVTQAVSYAMVHSHTEMYAN